MRVNFVGRRRLGRMLGLGGVFATMAFVQSAHALELRDMFIRFDRISTWESKGSDGEIRRGEPNKWTKDLTAIAGTIVVLGATGLCQGDAFYLVYKPGAHSGTVSCAPKRVGTSTSWHERGGSATFTTNTAIVGNVVTLQGTMEAKGIDRNSTCGRTYSIDKTERIVQSLKIRIVGRTCQVLQFHEATTRTEVWSGMTTPRTDVMTGTDRLAPRAKCTLIRPSEQPVAPPSKEGPADAVRSC